MHLIAAWLEFSQTLIRRRTQKFSTQLRKSQPSRTGAIKTVHRLKLDMLGRKFTLLRVFVQLLKIFILIHKHISIYSC